MMRPVKAGPAKARAERTLALARALLIEREIDLRGQIPLQELAHILKARAGVSYDTAKRHLHRAGMLMRGELAAAPQWGGAHGGHQKKEPPPLKTATVKAGSPIAVAISHPGGGYEHLGTGKAMIERVGTERVVKVDLGDGRTLVLTVF